MPFDINSQDAIADIAGIVVSAHISTLFLAGVANPVVAGLAGIAGVAVKSLIKGIKKEDKPLDKLHAVILEAVQSASKLTKVKMTSACQKSIVDDLLSEQNAKNYLQSVDKDKVLYISLDKIISGFNEEEVDFDQIKTIADNIIHHIQAGIASDPVLLVLDTNRKASNISSKLDEIYMMIIKLIENSKPSETTVPFWLTMPCKPVTPKYQAYYDYENVMKAIKEHKYILLYGMGGIGKTELLQKICEDVQSTYSHIAWIQYSKSLKDSLTSQITIQTTLELSQDERFEAIVRMMIAMGEKLLIFVDNIDSSIAEDPTIDTLQHLGSCKVIVSTRTPRLLSSFHDIFIERPPLIDCKKIFYAYSELSQLTCEDDLESIIKLAGQNTLVIEIIAKAVLIRKHTIPEMLEILKVKEFDISALVATAHSQEEPEKLLEQLIKLYDISQIRDKEVNFYILKNFSVLPYLPLSKVDTFTFMKLNEDQEQALYDLVALSWLEFTELGFALHPVIRQVVKQERIALDDCKTMILGFLEAADGYFSNIKYLNYIVCIAEAFSDTDNLVATMYNKLSLIYHDMGNLPEALAWQMKDKEISEELYPDGVHPDLATTYNNLSGIYQDMGNLQEALEWQTKDKEISEALFPEGVHPSLATTYNNLSGIYQAMGNLPEALEWQMKAKKISEVLFPDSVHPSLATTYNNLSTIYQAMGNLPEALKWQMKAKKIREALFPDGVHPSLSTTYNNLSGIYKDMGNLQEALEWQTKDKEISEALFPEGVHPSLATTYNNLSGIYQAMGNLPKALEWQMKAKKISEALFPDSVHPSLATTYNNLSTIYQAMGNLPEALDWQMKAKKIREELFPDVVHPSLATTYNNLSLIYQDMGNLPEALKWQMKAKKIREELFPDGVHPSLAATYNNLSTIYQAMGNLPEALAWQMKAKKIKEALFPDGVHPSLATTYNNLSTIYKAMGNLPEALDRQMKDKEIREALFPDGVHPSLATTYNNLSMIYQAMENLPEARKWQESRDKVMEKIEKRRIEFHITNR